MRHHTQLAYEQRSIEWVWVRLDTPLPLVRIICLEAENANRLRHVIDVCDVQVVNSHFVSPALDAKETSQLDDSIFSSNK